MKQEFWIFIASVLFAGITAALITDADTRFAIIVFLVMYNSAELRRKVRR